MVQVPSWVVRNFPSFNIFLDDPNEGERKGLVQKKKNLVDYIFGDFDIMMWWEFMAREGSTAYPFEEVTDRSKIPLVLSVKLAQLKTKFEWNITGCTREIKNVSN